MLVKYHLMEVQRQPLPAFAAWLESSPTFKATWLLLDCPQGSLSAFGLSTAKDLVGSGALRLHGEVLLDAP